MELGDKNFVNSSNDTCKLTGNIIGILAFLWSIFQLFIASPLPSILATNDSLNWVILTDFKSKVIHLSFAFLLLFLLFPTFTKGSRNNITFLSCVFACLSVISTMYLVVMYDELSLRIAMPNNLDIVISCCGILFLLEGARRSIGMPIVVVALLFLVYSIFGQYMPDLIAHKGNSLAAIASHEWLSAEGVFGVALGVSSNFVFLYVLFGALLDKAGAGNFFIRLSFILLQRFVGGPAKAAVVASGFMGMMSGSSIANTITIGSFTIPLMKKMGLSAEKAAAIEVSAGVNGQIMPPVMGAAAFLMSEFLSIPYADIVKYAFVPAIMIYVTLLYIVHLEACKLNMRPVIDLTEARSIYFIVLKFLIFICCLFILVGFIYLVIEGIHLGSFYIPGIKAIFLDDSIYFISFVLVCLYIAILLCQFKKDSGENHDALESSDVWEILKQGLHYFIPVFILVWCLIGEKLSSSLSCFWTNLFLIFMLMTHDTINAVFRRNFSQIFYVLWNSIKKVYEAMVLGAKSMLTIAVATGTAGLIVGTVALTGFGLSIGVFIDHLANGSVFITLLMTAAICIILGMGMPTTGCYIIVSTLMVPILNAVVHKNGLSIPLVALHLFVFYFGLMADVTPPVGIASYAAAAIAKGNAFKTSVQSFLYNIRTMIVPFLFVFNSDIILYDIDNVWSAALSILVALVSIMSISAGMQGYFFVKSKLYESIILIAVGIILIIPGHIIGFFVPKYMDVSLSEVDNIITVKSDSSLLMTVEHQDDNGEIIQKDIVIPLVHGFQGTLIDMIKKKVGIDVVVKSLSSGVVKLDVKNIASWSYVDQSDIEVKDSIVKLKLSIQKNLKMYVYFISFIVLIVLIFVQLRHKTISK
ncbi:TRAP transporter fused permease subunit [Neoehrlichia mikurensis]|uniref:TRAP transporter permease n=1 Tax=Neoehrlichia mikurensis TaxID=89586 RepID=A0A9Q9BVM0_9RICK|nr:TRAP transporter fused permease subunit [Neoehrlichia mikurensis]QXK91716.1 TRAP transporter fused permease subunit [Neoehrlichia mikurensis]QXK92928.1 TRAP transporter fused permease subunit [Neoehrlichia mikurensis]QXK93406.1 TRAP transporter fused permease subunit [Neoehrlichia mikurensis]UTO55643.1 TRAP transporter permease [Neoehrlichia mikurensis]UTO56563.1 TRAP transporter permease [Neoehrlichia mikurensis]